MTGVLWRPGAGPRAGGGSPPVLVALSAMTAAASRKIAQASSA
jgi:hypothetical protein